MKRILMAILILFTVSSFANATTLSEWAAAHEVAIGYAPVCKHYYTGEDMNEDINFVMVSVDKWTLATYKNTHFERSYFFGRTFNTEKRTLIGGPMFFRLNLHLGLLSGYADEIPSLGNVTLAMSPTVEFGYGKVSVEMMGFPLLGCMLKYTF